MYTDKKQDIQSSNTNTENSSTSSTQQKNNTIKSLKNLTYIQKNYKQKTQICHN